MDFVWIPCIQMWCAWPPAWADSKVIIHSLFTTHLSDNQRFAFDNPFSQVNDTHQDDNDNQENDLDNGQNGDDENPDGQPKPAAVKKKRVRKQLSTITKNKDTLNARLDTIPLPDPLFSKLNTIMGDVSSSNRLLMNILQTRTSDMRLIQDHKYWDSAECAPNVYSETNEYDWTDAEITTLPVALDIKDKNALRQQLAGYLITNTPIDDDE